jgi:predicted transposase/invertase (TIGR01784 family)
MVKFRGMGEKDIRNDPLHRWLAWLDQDSPPELVEEAVKMDRAIQKAEAKVKHISHDKESLRAYEMRQMALSDFNTAVNSARREGIQEGLKEGIREGLKAGEKEGIKKGLREGEGKKAAEIARNLKAAGAPAGQIAQVTGLSETQIRDL